MIYWIYPIFSLINILLGFIDAHKLFKHRWIYHGINGVVYAAICFVPYHYFHNWWMIGGLLFDRLLFFNISLSKFRSLDWDYVTPENPPKAIVDRVAKFIFGMNGKLMYAFYLAWFIFLVIKTFL